MRKITAGLWACLVLPLVGGCGGAGDSSGSPASGGPTYPAPPPTPSPSPTPTPTSLAPFGLRQDAAMQFIGLIQTPGVTGGGPRWLASGEVAMSWLTASHTFAMTIAPYGSGILVDDPVEAAPSARYLVDTQGSRLAQVNVFIPPGSPGASPLILTAQWSRLASDSLPDGTAGMLLYYTADSIRTPPASGAASYRFGIAPASTARISFDFAAGTVTGEVPLTWEDAWGPYSEVRYAIRDGRYDRATGSFTGTFDIPGSGFAGEVRGQIVGASGQAMAIVIRGATIDPYENKWVAQNSFVTQVRE